MKKVLRICLAIALCFALSAPALAIEGIWHNPYGIEDLYETQPTERAPRDPAAGEMVYIKSTTWPIESGQIVWLTYTKNGVKQQDIGAAWKYNQGNNSYWEVAFGPFAKGDVIEYTVHADKDSQGTKDIGPFSFTVAGWEKAQSVSLASQTGGTVVLNVTPNAGSFRPKLGLSFPTAGTLHFQLSPKGNAQFESGITDYTVNDTGSTVVISTSALRVTVTKSPYGIAVYDLINSKALTHNGGTGSELSWLTDGNNIISGVKEGYSSPSAEQFYGFGERYNGIQQRGKIVDTHVFNQYQNQGSKTYLAVPFFYSSKGYGVYLNSTYYSQFDMAATSASQYTFRADTNGASATPLDYYLISGNPSEVISGYTQLTGKPQELPKWAFGLWMSANEWDRQSEVLDAVDKSKTNDIPATVVVLEQWSDENTFYIFNDSTYTAKPGSDAFQYNDFNFSAKWPNPKAMTDTVHDNGMKLLLWQVPVLKHTDYAWEQKDNDEAYMVSQGYAVGNGSGGQYRTPTGSWFGDSLLLDFTNPSAVDWWMAKRGYLFDGVGIDGFKTDGGEMVWGRDASFYNGSNGQEMRNAYPNAYIKGYNDFSAQKTGTGMTFSRAGTSGVQTKGAFWAGDQTSNFSAFKDAVSAGLSSGISGVPFWGWDLAGFTGSFPTSELYKRSTMMSAFSPIMQFHSEKANPSTSEERSPWNVQARTGDSTIISHFQKYTNVRMNILPYIYSEAQQCSSDGTPLMRAMLIDFPNAPNVYALDEQYMFGRNLLVAPILNEGQTVKQVYLPDGEWIDLFHNSLTSGGGAKSYYSDVNTIPVYIRNGSIIPLNLNQDYQLGGSIGNDIVNYTNLVFRVYPSGESSYTLVNDDKTTMNVHASENFAAGTVSVSLPAVTIPVTTQVFGTMPTGVTVGGTALAKVDSIAALKAASNAYYYSTVEKLTYVKAAPSSSAREIVLTGIHQAPYEAEHAVQTNVAVNTNHTGYLGEGFVDQFSEVGDSVEFTVFAKQAGAATLDIRYCAGTEVGQRTLSINKGQAASVTLPKTADWDTWGTVSIPVTLVNGQNTIKISYAAGNFSGINLDCISLR